MIQETDMAKHFWAKVINTTCYIQNRISITPILDKTPYELWKNRKPNISYFHPFGCECFMLNTKDNIGKFDYKAQKCLLLGYYECSKGYKIFNTETRSVEESIHVIFNDKLDPEKSKLVEKFIDLNINLSESKDTDSGEKDSESKAKESVANDSEATQPESIVDLTHQKKSRSRTSHYEELIPGDKNAPVRTISSFKPSEEILLGLISLIEPTSIDEALLDTE